MFWKGYDLYFGAKTTKTTYNKKIRFIFRSQNPQKLRLFDTVRILGFCWYVGTHRERGVSLCKVTCKSNGLGCCETTAVTTKCGGSTVMPGPCPPTFRHCELRRSLIAQKNLIIHEPSRKNTRNFRFAVQIEIFRESQPPPTLPFVTQHTLV